MCHGICQLLLVSCLSLLIASCADGQSEGNWVQQNSNGSPIQRIKRLQNLMNKNHHGFRNQQNNLLQNRVPFQPRNDLQINSDRLKRNSYGYNLVNQESPSGNYPPTVYGGNNNGMYANRNNEGMHIERFNPHNYWNGNNHARPANIYEDGNKNYNSEELRNMNLNNQGGFIPFVDGSNYIRGAQLNGRYTPENNPSYNPSYNQNYPKDLYTPNTLNTFQPGTENINSERGLIQYPSNERSFTSSTQPVTKLEYEPNFYLDEVSNQPPQHKHVAKHTPGPYEDNSCKENCYYPPSNINFCQTPLSQCYNSDCISDNDEDKLCFKEENSDSNNPPCIPADIQEYSTEPVCKEIDCQFPLSPSNITESSPSLDHNKYKDPYYRGASISQVPNRIVETGMDSRNTTNKSLTPKNNNVNETEEEVIGEFKGRIVMSSNGMNLCVDYLSLPGFEI